MTDTDDTRRLQADVPAIIHERAHQHASITGRSIDLIVTEALMFYLQINPSEVEPEGMEA